MRLDELKKGFWGYKKESVYQYIAMLEEEASKKLEQQRDQAQKEAVKAEKRIHELEEALRLLREENGALSREQLYISEAMLEAQKFSKQIKEEVLRQQEEARQEMKSACEVHTKQLEEYSAKIGKLSRVLKELLEDMVVETEQVEEEAGRLKEQTPISSLSVFPKKPGNGRQESA